MESHMESNMELKSEQYFDHEADIGIIGRGKTIPDAFVSAAEAVFKIMVDIGDVEPQSMIPIEFEESDIELALVTWLNLLISHARGNGLVFCRFELTQQADHWKGAAWGEPWRDNMVRGTEVKGATLTMLSVKKVGDGWEARVVVDV